MTRTISPGRRITVTFASADPDPRRDDVTDPDPRVVAALWRVAAAARAFGFCDRTDRRESCNLPDCQSCTLRDALAALDAAMEGTP